MSKLKTGSNRHVVEDLEIGTPKKVRSELNFTRSKQQFADVDVLAEDVEEAVLPLNEISEFLDSHFGDYSDAPANTSLHFGPSIASSVIPACYVEHPTTGLFVAVPTLSSDDGAEDSDDEEDTDPLLGKLDHDMATPAVESAIMLTATVSFFQVSYLFFQGLLAGFSAITIYQTSLYTDNEDLLLAYQPRANETRRLFYILSTVSLVGAIDVVINTFTHKTSVKGGSVWSFWESLPLPTSGLVLLCYIICFLCTVITAGTDVLIQMKSGENDINSPAGDVSWAEVALQDSDFAAFLELWKTLTKTRLTFALLGWAASCVFILLDKIIHAHKDYEVASLRDFAWKLQQRVQNLLGNSTGNSDELRELIATQRIALQRSEDALQSLLATEGNIQ